MARKLLCQYVPPNAQRDTNTNTNPHPHPRLPSLPPSETMDPHGDTWLRVGLAPAAQRDFKVGFARLLRASPAWYKVHLSGLAHLEPYAEASWEREGGCRVIRLPGEKPDALRILLALAHGRYALVPGRLDPALVYEVVVAAGRYGMLGALRPWVEGWVGGVCARMVPGEKGPVEVLRAVHVAWELGRERDLIEVGKAFVFGSPLSDLQMLEDTRAEMAAWGVPCGPGGFVMNIIKVRGRLIDNGVNFWSRVLRGLHDAARSIGSDTCCQVPCHPDNQRERKECDNYIRDTILWHLANSHRGDGSIVRAHCYIPTPLTSLLDVLMDTETALKLGFENRNGHDACRPRLVNIHDLSSTKPNPTHEESQWNYLLSAEDKERLLARRKMMGSTRAE